jgi:predicted phage terminase large subunit-like protein
MGLFYCPKWGGMMNELQKDLLIEACYKHYSDDAVLILKEFPLTGSGGLRRMLGEIDREYFCRAYLSDLFDKEFGSYAREILDELAVNIESQMATKEAIIAPRGHGKSTLSSVAIPAWAALYKKKKFTFFISANGDTAANFLEKVKKALESPEIIQDFGQQKGKVWNADNICLQNGCWVGCTGWKSGIRGINKDRRPDLIILDDLEDKSVMESDALRTKLETCFNEEIGRLGDYDTDMFYIGTLLSTDSLLARVIKMPSWKTMFFQRVLSFPDEIGEKLWEEWRKIYRDIGNLDRMDDSYSFYLEHKEEMLKGTKILWEGKTPEDKMKYAGAYYNVMLDREAFGEDAFWKEDQNEPRSAKDKPFKTLTYWQSWPEQIKKLKLAVDPSEGKGDSTAYVVGGEYNGGLYIKDGKLALHNPYQVMDEIVRLIKEYPDIDEVLLENNLFKGLLNSELIKKLCENDCYRQVPDLTAHDNKEVRILKMEPDITGGKILFNELNTTFNEQVKDFSIKPKCKHDDAPDGLQILFKKLKTPSFYMA